MIGIGARLNTGNACAKKYNWILKLSKYGTGASNANILIGSYVVAKISIIGGTFSDGTTVKYTTARSTVGTSDTFTITGILDTTPTIIIQKKASIHTINITRATNGFECNNFGVIPAGTKGLTVVSDSKMYGVITRLNMQSMYLNAVNITGNITGDSIAGAIILNDMTNKVIGSLNNMSITGLSVTGTNSSGLTLTSYNAAKKWNIASSIGINLASGVMSDYTYLLQNAAQATWSHVSARPFTLSETLNYATVPTYWGSEVQGTWVPNVNGTRLKTIKGKTTSITIGGINFAGSTGMPASFFTWWNA